MKTKSILLGLVIATSSLPSFAKLECVDGVVTKGGQALTAEQVTAKKQKINDRLNRMKQSKAKTAKHPKKRQKRLDKLTKKLEVLNTCN
ncbi:MAG: hypothetical protein OXU45_08145 [Candidatus Melainabacteria bacterium]|nr:hypothetical protein [Candidatus Melainabacteria bacterium]